MTNLILPRRTHEALKRQEKDAAAASSIAARRPEHVYSMDSDDFVSPVQVGAQLQDLQAYVDRRRETEGNEAYHLPRPSGWKLCLLVLTIPETSQGGVVIVSDSREAKSLSSPQGVILSMGPAAYTGDRFVTQDVISLESERVPWHKVGDRISFVKYDAHMFQLANGQRLGFLNDTQPLALIDDGWTVPC